MSEKLYKGDIVLVRFPFTDLSTDKLRPALVLTKENDLGDVCLAFITSRHMRSGSHDLPLPMNSTMGLKTDSMLRLEKIATVQRSLIIGKIGALSKNLLSQVNTRLAELFQLTSI